MKKLFCTIGLALVVGCAALTGGGFQTVAGKFLTSTAVTVDAAMQAYAKANVAGMTTASQDATVKTTYGQYQVYFAMATNAYTLALTASDPGLFVDASNKLFLSKTALVNVTISK